MARKRLNKKLVAILLLIMIPVLLVFGLATDSKWPWLPGPIHRLMGRDPETLYQQGQELIQQACQLEQANQAQAEKIEDPKQAYETLQKLKEEQYHEVAQEADKTLKRAYRFARRDIPMQHKIVSTLADFYYQQGNYTEARKYWLKLVDLDPSDYEARKKTADFMYQTALASPANTDIWSAVQKESSSLLDYQPEDLYALSIQAEALLELLRMGAVQNAQATCQDIEQLLEKILQIDPNHILGLSVQARLYLWQVQNGLVKANPEQEQQRKDQLYQQAQENYQKAIENHPDSLEARRYYYEDFLFPRWQKQFFAAMTEQDPERRKPLRDQADLLFDEIVKKYLDPWINQFPDEGVFQAMKGFIYLAQVSRVEDIDDPIKYYESALRADPTRVDWYLALGQAYRTRAEYDPDHQLQDYLYAYNLLYKGLYRPESMDLEGPLRMKNISIRYGGMIPLFIDLCVSLSQQSQQDEDKIRYLETADSFLKELQDKIGRDRSVVKIAEGSIALGEERKEEAVRLFYEADQQMTATGAGGVVVARLKWKLFESLKDSEFKFLAARYANESLQMTHHPVQHIMEYLDILFQLPVRQVQNMFLQVLDTYEPILAENPDYRQKWLRMKVATLLNLSQEEQARELVDQLTGDELEVQWLRARCVPDQPQRIQALQALALQNPSHWQLTDSLYRYYMENAGQNPEYIPMARQMLDAAEKEDPKNRILQQRQLLLKEPDPLNVSPERKDEIGLQVIQENEDELQRNLELGQYYWVQAQRIKENPQQEEEYQKKLRQAQECFSKASQVDPGNIQALKNQFQVASVLQDQAALEEVVRQINRVSPTESLLYEATLEMNAQQWEKAENHLRAFLERRPISIQGHMMMAEIYNYLQQNERAVLHARTAVQQDLHNLSAIRLLMSILHGQYLARGLEDLKAQEIEEMLTMGRTILISNPSDEVICRLQTIYNMLRMDQYDQALKSSSLNESTRQEYTTRFDQLYRQTVGLCQMIKQLNPQEQMASPTLANLHYLYAQIQKDPEQQKELLQKAEQEYQQALESNPESVELLFAYGEFLSKIGRHGEDEKLLENLIEKTENPEICAKARIRLADLYQRKNQLDQAGQVLEQAYSEGILSFEAGVKLIEISKQNNQYERALAVIQELRNQEDSEPLTADLVQILLTLKQFEQAESELDKMRQNYPQSLQVNALAGELALRRGNYAQAITYAEKDLEKEANNYTALWLKGRALYYNGQLNEARAVLSSLRPPNPAEEVKSRLLIAQIAWRLGLYSQAIDELGEVVDQNPGNRSARQLLTRMFYSRKRWEDLEFFYDGLIKNVDIQTSDLYFEAGIAMVGIGDFFRDNQQKNTADRKYEKGLDHLGKSLDMSQNVSRDRTGILDGVLSTLLRLERFQQVIQTLQKYPEESKSPALRLHEAEALYRLAKQQGDPQQEQGAYQAFENLLETTERESGAAEMVLAKIMELWEPAVVRDWARKKLQQKPDWFMMHLLLSRMYKQNGQIQEHISELQKSLDLCKDARLSFGIQQTLSVTYLQSQQWEQAVQLGEKLVQEHPGNPNLLNNLAYALLQKGDHPDRAMEMAEKAYSINRIDPDIMDTYAMALAANQQLDQAESILLQAIQQAQKDQRFTAEYEFHLAKVLMEKGQTGRVQKRLEDALRELKDQDDPLSKMWKERIDEWVTQLNEVK